MIEVDRCPVCDGDHFVPYLSCTDHAVSHETFQLKRCSSCDLIITSPRPPSEKLMDYYVSAAYTSHIGKPKSLLDRLYLSARTFTLKWKLSLIEQNTSAGTEKSLLDFGAGTGEFVKVAATAGWQTMGVEPSSTARNNADPTIRSNLHSTLTTITDQNRKFDAITAWHVLEHVDTLNETLRTLSNLLAPHGMIFIAVPNHESWDAEYYKKEWAAYDVPRHLWHFKNATMHKLLSRNSLHVVKTLPMRLDAFYVSLLSEKYLAGHLSPAVLLKSIINGFRSNLNAIRNTHYSSVIYIAQR